MTEPEHRSYYGRSIIKEPVWKPEIPWYFFTGGIGGTSASLALAARLAGNDRLSRNANLVALAAMTVSPILLVKDLGRPQRFVNMLPVFKVTCRATGAFEEVTDLGRAILTGKCADLAKFKGPTLRGLSARAPYFHNGAADSIDEVITFYDRRFHIGFLPQEIADLKAFLQTL
jgi:hypothetical protein